MCALVTGVQTCARPISGTRSPAPGVAAGCRRGRRARGPFPSTEHTDRRRPFTVCEHRVRERVGRPAARGDRKSVVQGKSVSVRADLGGRRVIKKKTLLPTYRKNETVGLPLVIYR